MQSNKMYFSFAFKTIFWKLNSRIILHSKTVKLLNTPLKHQNFKYEREFKSSTLYDLACPYLSRLYNSHVYFLFSRGIRKMKSVQKCYSTLIRDIARLKEKMTGLNRRGVYLNNLNWKLSKIKQERVSNLQSYNVLYSICLSIWSAALEFTFIIFGLLN